MREQVPFGWGRGKDLHASPRAEDRVEGRFLLDAVGQGATTLQLLASEGQVLLVQGDALLVLDLGLPGMRML